MSLYPPLNELITELEGETDPYLLYLKGVLHMRVDQRKAAVACFCQSLREKAYNWSCWSQMAQLVNSADMVGVLN